MLDISGMHMTAFFALHQRTVMLHAFRIAGTAKFALHSGGLLCFGGACRFALIGVLMDHLFLA